LIKPARPPTSLADFAVAAFDAAAPAGIAASIEDARATPAIPARTLSLLDTSNLFLLGLLGVMHESARDALLLPNIHLFAPNY
jgi:hypothetical protein